MSKNNIQPIWRMRGKWWPLEDVLTSVCILTYMKLVRSQIVLSELFGILSIVCFSCKILRPNSIFNSAPGKWKGKGKWLSLGWNLNLAKMNSVKVMMMSVRPKHDDLSIWGMQEMQVRDFFEAGWLYKDGDDSRDPFDPWCYFPSGGGSNLPRTLDWLT